LVIDQAALVTAIFIAACTYFKRATALFEHSTLHRPRPHVELQSQRVHDFNNRRKAGVALFAQGLVKPFAGDAGVAVELDHAARPCNVANGLGEQGGVFWCFVHAGLKVLRAVFVGLQVVGGTKGFDAKLCGGGGVHHSSHVSKSAVRRIWKEAVGAGVVRLSDPNAPPKMRRYVLRWA